MSFGYDVSVMILLRILILIKNNTNIISKTHNQNQRATLCIYIMKVLHNSCNTVTRGQPSMSALGLWVYISGRPVMYVLQLLIVHCIVILHEYIQCSYVHMFIYIYD